MDYFYGDACEHLPVKLVPWKHCGVELHRLCQHKYEHSYGMSSDMVHTFRPFIDKKHHDVIEKAKKQADDDTGTGTSDKETTNEEDKTIGIVEETNEEDKNISIVEETNDEEDKSLEEMNEEDETVPKPYQSQRGKANRPTTTRNLSTYIKKKKCANCKKEARIKIRRDNLFHMLRNDNQKEDMQKHGSSPNFHGEIISGNGKQGCNVKFDDFPADDQMVRARRRNIIVVIEEG